MVRPRDRLGRRRAPGACRCPGAHEWVSRLEAGETHAGTPAEGTPCPYLSDVRTFALAPLLVASRLWGFLALGEVTTDRTWTAAERDAVAAAAAAVATAMERQQATRALRESVEALSRSNEDRQRLLARLVKAQEEERERVANDLHDDSIQIMTAVGLRLAVLRGQVKDGAAEQTLTNAEATVAEAIRRLRRVLFELRPLSLDSSGLATAIGDHVRLMDEPDAPEFSIDDRLLTEPPVEARTILYRIAQEALTNVRKHARAEHAWIELSSEGEGVRVRIRDDGVGFDPSSRPNGGLGHVGIPSMRERANLAGGWLRIDGTPGAGTTVECWIPRIAAPPNGDGSATGADPGPSVAVDPA